MMPDRTPAPPAFSGTHAPGLGAVAYAEALAPQLAKLLPGEAGSVQKAIGFVLRTICTMQPRDPLEELLIIQAIMAHARALHLTTLATAQTEESKIRVTAEHAEKAANTFRRLMLALGEYRKPPRAGDSFTAIKQANIAQQQVVMKSENSPRENTTNEQGSSHAQADHHAPETLETLPADTGRPGIPASLRGPRAAVGAVHGPEDTRGQGPKPDERLEAR